jgi:hypothetical protein
MKKIIFVLAFTIIGFFSYSQTYEMNNYDDQTISTCSGTFTLGSYTAGQSFTTTICSTDPINDHIRLVIAGGYSFPVGTSLCVYDGTSTSDWLLVCFSSSTVGGIIAIEGSNMNESGCLTFVFTSGPTGASWSGTLTCEFVCQARQVNITSANPAIQGDDYINVCWDETTSQSMPVQMTANGTYPSTSYPCTDATNTFTWNFQDGTPNQSGMGLTTVTHNFPARQGYTVIVTIEDSQGCENTNSVNQRVRVSRAPIWNTSTTTASPAEICMGSPVNMCGNYTSNTWYSEVPTSVANAIAIPDGNGVCLESHLTQNQFEPGQILYSINDLLGIHIQIAHSYLGNLTFFIQCPNGYIVQMEIQGGGGTYLGNPGPNHESPADDVGAWYNITPTATTTMANAAVGGTLAPGNYASYQSLSGLIGCSLNGQWTIRICDNLATDEGVFFGWWIEFNPSLYPDLWSYNQNYTPLEWSGLYGSQITDPINQNCATGTYTTTSNPTENTVQPFIFEIMDDFGCIHDTSLNVTVYNDTYTNCCQMPNPHAGTDSAVCGNTYNLSASPLGLENNGVWTIFPEGTGATFTDATNPITTVNVGTGYGIYQFIWTEYDNGDLACTDNDTVQVEFVELPVISAGEDLDVCGNSFQMAAISAGFDGTWLPDATYFEDISNPNTNVISSIYGERSFYWIETNYAITQDLSCISQDEVVITLFPEPTANIISDFNDTIFSCGMVYYGLESENPGTGITGCWISDEMFIPVEGSNISSSLINLMVSEPGIANFYWYEQNGPTELQCRDTAGPATIFFASEPNVSAGIDDSIYSFNYVLKGIGNYSTSNQFPVLTTWQNDDALFSNPQNDTSLVTVPIYGEYEFVLKIYFEDFPSCASSDTVSILFEEMVIEPIAVIVDYGLEPEMPDTSDITVYLYQQIDGGKSNSEYILHSALQPGSNGQVIFNDLEPGNYFLSSILSHSENYPNLLENIYYNSAMVIDDATAINYSDGSTFIIYLNHQASVDFLGTNTAYGKVGFENIGGIIGVSGQVVILYNVDSEEVIDVSVTDDNGNYSFAKVPDYTNIEIFVSSFEHPQHTSFETMTSGTTDYNINFILELILHPV